MVVEHTNAAVVPHQQAACVEVAATLVQHEAAEVVSLAAECEAMEDSLAAECEAAEEADSLVAEEDAGKGPFPTSPGGGGVKLV